MRKKNPELRRKSKEMRPKTEKKPEKYPQKERKKVGNQNCHLNCSSSASVLFVLRRGRGLGVWVGGRGQLKKRNKVEKKTMNAIGIARFLGVGVCLLATGVGVALDWVGAALGGWAWPGEEKKRKRVGKNRERHLNGSFSFCLRFFGDGRWVGVASGRLAGWVGVSRCGRACCWRVRC